MGANNVLLGFPVYSDVGVLVSPSLDSGSWVGALPLTNLQNRRSAQVARSTDAALSSTRLRCDLKQDRAISVIHVPKHTISIAGKARVLGVPSSMLFDYEAGDDVTAKVGTFSRASIATYVDSAGVLHQVVAGALRDAHFIGGKRCILVEPGTINLITDSENLGAWSRTNAPVVTPGQADPYGTTLATLVDDQNAGADCFIDKGITFTGDGTKAFSVFARAGSASQSDVWILDTTAAATRAIMRLTWSAGVPSAAVPGGSGSVIGSPVAYTGGWYRILFQANGIIAANANRIRLMGAASGSTPVGSTYWFGPQAEDSTIPTSYMPTGVGVTATRSAEILSFTVPAGLSVPVALTAYMKFVELGTGLVSGSNARNWQIAEAANSNNSIRTGENGGKYASVVNDSGGSAIGTSAAAAVPAYGDTVEHRTLLTTTTVQLGQSINGAAEVLAAASAPFALPVQWGSGGTAMIWIGSRNGASPGTLALQSFRIASGGAVSLASIQAMVYDSGWVDVWPQVYPTGSLPVGHPSYATGKITAEDAVGYKMGLTVIPSSPFVGRYWSLQIDDSGNAAGYIDLSRIIVAGGWRPSLNLTVGAKLGWETSSERIPSDGDGALYRPRPRRRAAMIELDDLPDDEWLVDPLEIQRRLGISGQMVFVFDTTDTYHKHRRSFLAVLRELSPIALASCQHGRVPLSVVEEV